MLEAIELCQEISGRTLNWEYKEDNRIGDHIWWVSDVSKFQSHYPAWRVSLRPQRDSRSDPRCRSRITAAHDSESWLISGAVASDEPREREQRRGEVCALPARYTNRGRAEQTGRWGWIGIAVPLTSSGLIAVDDGPRLQEHALQRDGDRRGRFEQFGPSRSLSTY